MDSYPISFSFRGRYIKGWVQDYGPPAFVGVTDEEILRDFSGSFKFILPGKTCDPYIRNKDAKDSATLVKAIRDQLH